MKKIILKDGRELIIRKANVDDAEKMIVYLDIIAGETDNLTFGVGEIGITEEQERFIIDESLNNPVSLFVVAEIEKNIVSMLNFHGGKRPRTMHSGEFGITVRRDYWNLGIAKEMIKFMFEWAKQTEIIRKINLRVRSDNTKAINVYKSLGFKNEGIITRDLIINGIFYDSITMGINID
jgi:RimJ/RimL family protein N-acetyltransferase